jgi:zinc/manganese transport system substrate-binding protein
VRRLSLRLTLIAVSALTLAAALAACGSSATAGGSGKVQVVAAENFWGSLARQLGGDKASVHSIIVNPNTDPHSYEPSAQDSRAMAVAQLAIVNGIGYDPWAPKLLAASPAGGRVTLTVGDLLGLKQGDNPHQWYSPPHVQQVIDQITSDYKKLDPKDAAYFDRQRATVNSRGLTDYHALIARIKARYARVPAGASESIFAPLSQALGLNLLTPPGYLKAISEGTDPTAADKAAVDRQIATGQIKVWVFNSQNSTPDVQRLTDAARSHGIPVTTVTETLVPASASFQQWQSTQLKNLEQALAKATGR